MMNWASPDPLLSLTHLDGRNAHKLTTLRPYFSEFAWMKMRVSVMIDYVVALYTFLEAKHVSFTHMFSFADARQIRALEAKTNHDLKAIEQFLVVILKKKKLGFLIPFVNLGIGSEDINSIAFARLMGKCRKDVLMPNFQKIAEALVLLADAEKETLMVARTHAQAANLTTFGKEVVNSLLRLCDEVEIFSSLQFCAKCTGEAGSLQGFLSIDKTKDWLKFTDDFISNYGFIPTHAATQITPYDSFVRFLQSLERMNSILLDFVKNMWLYVLIGYVKVNKVESEVDSAGMPHKVNPIHFEGAEGGLELANGIFETLCRTLPINRLQRDFSDSTVRRSLSLPIGLSVLSYQSIAEGLKRISVDHKTIADSLERHQEVYIESVKVFCQRRGDLDIYDRLKSKTRGQRYDNKQLRRLLIEFKAEMPPINPYPAKIVDEAVARAKKVFFL